VSDEPYNPDEHDYGDPDDGYGREDYEARLDDDRVKLRQGETQ
jgi:hypothetical protein